MTDFLEWHERWNTDITDIDEQHIALARQINRIVEVLRQSGEGEQRSKALENLLDELYDLTRAHFTAEEAMMRQNDYPDYAAHHKEHVMLLAELVDYIREIQQGRAVLDIGSLRELRSWFVVHLAQADAAFASYYHKKMSN